MKSNEKPAILITGAAGNIGRKLTERLADRYHVLGIDLPDNTDGPDMFGCDITDRASVEDAVQRAAKRAGGRFASVVHLAAYFDFSGEERPQYERINEEGSRNLLRALQDIPVEQLVYSGTMLVHEPGVPGERIDEETPFAPGWAYPKSKARTEEVIREEAGDISTVFLHLAGLYSDQTAVPTLSHQIARIYERDFKSHTFSGDMKAGQSFIHIDDMLDLFERVIERRDALEPGTVLLAGEPDAMGYGALQDRIGQLIHGEDHWRTLNLPAPVAKAGAALETSAEPVVPDAFDQGEKPFIRAFMIDMASDHYALDISKARHLLDWEPQHRIAKDLPVLIEALKDDPLEWYRANGITPPNWLEAADERVDDPEKLRSEHERIYRQEHRQNIWGAWANAGLGIWLMTSPPLLGYDSAGMILSDLGAGFALLVFGLLSLSWRMTWARFAAAATGCWVMFSPLVLWTENGAAYLNATLVGMLAVGFALCLRPTPGVSPVAARTGPTIPKGWDYSPSDWFQRLPVIMLAVVGLLISRYLTAYQLGTVDSVWEPFFAGTVPGKNGTEQIITSEVSEAWPVPDAGIGALTYALEILVGIIGSSRRWRTMPWLVVLFGIMIVPLGAVSIFFIVIQPIVIGTYSTLALIAAAAMVWQIPYSLDELVATYQFLRRRHAAGHPWIRVFFFGDTDEGPDNDIVDDFERSPPVIVKEMIYGGMTFPWNFWALMALGVALMLSPLLFGWQAGGMSATSHIVGALAITVTVAALAPVARLGRFLNVLLGLVMIFAPFMTEAGIWQLVFAIVSGALLMGLSIPRGPVHTSFDTWDRFIR
ncbi:MULTISPECIES: NAD-dependent epimerase/dehydratase family protein [unclassified Sulfitobacter]|uniref:NAD-dependent epimerase/dehydratase family protein n=1 Tax=unclassified Sulfitobacter TaxID=196795 RepID=UPI0007C2936F|nr:MULTISPECIES: NAD-dependent epimerase/dehydratase family protein [unclassified Sulfitobacter]KZY02665.1 DNA polymerase III subunit epsilon [Sulfitobacter sp. HI0023]KZY24269.1 DNA polymerase III subunit epsilon [Sulfitobacter sp. HI0040]KZZ70271.1 DNA polymerase III subunit epsilon [Sulfitobacter sp. HI0129]